MDGVGTPIIERPRPLPGHDTPNPTQHPYTLKCEEPAKVARNLTRSFFAIGHKRCNFNDRISMSEIWARELRATLLGSQPDWKPTRETTYQHTRRGCDGRRMVRRTRASFATQRRAKRDRQVSRAGLATADTTARRALHPLRGATPVTGRDTRSEEVHCLRIGCSAPNHKNKRGICETTADTHKAPGTRAPGASAHSDQPTLHVAPSRPSATVTTAAARRSRSGPLGQHGPDQRIQRLVLGRSRTGRTRADTSLAARARQYVDRDSPATRPYKTLRISLTNQVADSLVPARRA